VTSSAPTRKPGEPQPPPLVAPGIAPHERPTSGFQGIISGSGSAAPGMSPALEPLSGKPAKVSPGRQHKRATARAKTTIAISAEVITGQLDELNTAERMLALVELIRRFTRRLETEGAILVEMLVDKEDDTPANKKRKRRD
jgi:hypothetical protein